MSSRVRAARVMVRWQLREALVSPGYFIALGVGIALGYALLDGFARAIDSSGFNWQLRPVSGLVGRAIEGAFGTAFLNGIFSEGPFPLVFLASYAPVFLFVSISSAFKLGMEKNAGAIELLSYGPADGTAYLIASFGKDLALLAVAALFLLVFMTVAAPLYNFALGPGLVTVLLSGFFLSAAFLAWGILASALAGNASSSVAIFLGVLILFFVLLLGSLSIASSTVRSVSSVIAWTIQWVSPFFYASLGLTAFSAGDVPGFILGLALQMVLAAVLLFAGHLAMSARGVRA